MTAQRGAAEYLGSWEAGSPEWHAARSGRITGSRIAAVLGLSPWESKFSLWHRMAGLITDEIENDLMRWGKLLEPVVLGEYARQRDADGTFDQHPGTWANTERPWQAANPDAMGLAYPRIVEAKYAPMGDGWGEPGTDEIPIYYRAQVLWYLDTFGGPEHGYDRADVAVFFGVNGYAEYTVAYSPDECQFMRDRASEFLATLDRGERPDIDQHSSTYQTVRELNPDIDDERIEIDDAIAIPYLDAIQAHKDAEGEKQRTAAALLDAMGRSRRAYHAGQQIAMRVPGRGNNPPSIRHTPIKATGQKVSAA